MLNFEKYVCDFLRIIIVCNSSKSRSEQSLVRWATPQLHDIDSLTKMVDPALNGLYPVKSCSRFADVIALSVQVMHFAVEVMTTVFIIGF